MENAFTKALVESGFSEGEAALYGALVSLGEATVQEAANAAGIKRASAYAIFKMLQERKLVVQTKVKGRSSFVAVPAEEALRQVREAADHLAEQVRQFAATPRMKPARPRIYFLNGAEGFRDIWRRLFASGVKEYLIITDAEMMLGFVSEGYIENTLLHEKKKRGIRSRQLIAFSEYAKEIMARDASENRVSRLVPHTYKIPVTKIVFGDSVALISPVRENIVLIIESESIAKAERSLFEALWDSLAE